MKFGKTFREKLAARRLFESTCQTPRKVFAWFPVTASNHRIIWLEFVMERYDKLGGMNPYYVKIVDEISLEDEVK